MSITELDMLPPTIGTRRYFILKSLLKYSLVTVCSTSLHHYSENRSPMTCCRARAFLNQNHFLPPVLVSHQPQQLSLAISFLELSTLSADIDCALTDRSGRPRLERSVAAIISLIAIPGNRHPSHTAVTAALRRLSSPPQKHAKH
jgi:hypothetical protein